MAERIEDVEVPAEIKSGKAFNVTVHYTSAEGGTVNITYSAAFEGKPPSKDVPAGGSATFSMTITRVPGTKQKSCRITFTMGNKVIKQRAVT